MIDLTWQLYAIIIMVGLLTFILLGMPVAFALGVVSLLGILFFMGPESLPAFGHITWGAVNVFVFTAVPLFFLMSEVISFSGISGDVFDAMYKWLARLPGGLAIVSVLACAVFGAVSGTGIGVAAIVGAIAVPQMLQRGYDRKLSTGSVAASSALGMVIPPSIPLIVYGMVTEQSVGRLFAAGIIPGIITAGIYSAYIVIRVMIRPELAPSLPGVGWKERFFSLRKVWTIVALIVLVIGGIYAGIFTPTEAAGVGAVGAMLLAAMYRRLTLRNLWGALTSATRGTCMVIMIIIGAMLFGYLLTGLGVAASLTAWVVDLGVSRWVVFAIMHLIWLVLGCFLEVTSIILITMPILFPIALALGFDPIWFGIVMMINMCAAVVTPPMGLCAYVVKGIAPEVDIMDIFRGIIPFIFLVFIAIGIFIAFPQLVTWLPNLMLR